MPKREIRLHTRADPQWERVVFAEVLIPETPNVFQDFWTKEAIKEAAYMFMMVGFGIDINHDQVDVTGAVYMVESFIVRPGDPDFIEGSWVVGMKIINDQLWQDVLDNNINGFSYQALVEFLDAQFTMLDSGVRTGTTEAVLEGSGADGHTHTFMCIVDEANRPISGGTNVINGHYHTISQHTITDTADDHVHRYNMVIGTGGK